MTAKTAADAFGLSGWWSFEDYLSRSHDLPTHDNERIEAYMRSTVNEHNHRIKTVISQDTRFWWLAYYPLRFMNICFGSKLATMLTVIVAVTAVVLLNSVFHISPHYTLTFVLFFGILAFGVVWLFSPPNATPLTWQGRELTERTLPGDMPVNLKEAVRRLLSDPKVSHVRLFRAGIDPVVVAYGAGLFFGSHCCIGGYGTDMPEINWS